MRTIDVVIVIAYLIGITLFGLRFRAKERSLRTYFLADRNIPWWAISLSIVAAETSTLTIISIPGLAYDTNFGFLQIVFGYLVGRVIISLLFIPQYFKGELFTAYQLIEQRFGTALHKLTAFVFLLTRAAAEGVRVVAIATVIRIVAHALDFPISEIAAIGLITFLTLIYTFEGGMTAVIWTDVLQTAIYIGGTIVGLITLLHLVPGGWTVIHQMADAEHKFTVFDFSWSLTKTYTFWAGLIGGAFLTTASHGTDQLMVQRLLASRNERDSKIALLASGIAILIQFALFLLVGVALFVFYRDPSQPRHFAKSDEIFPMFIVEHMPHGISGLLIAAIFAAAMSNLSAALNSLSSTSVVDFYLRFFPRADERARTNVSRIFTVFWAAALFGLAILSRGGGRVVEVGLSIASVAYGGLLGVFLLGTLTRRATETGAIVGMLCGLICNLLLWKTPAAFHLPKVAWTWYVTIGASLTFIVGYLASMLTPPPAALEPREPKPNPTEGARA